jgi:glutamate-1-semialdehyde 2,1-aminomutase
LFILDDCLMLRLAYGGSAEKFGLAPDLTFLGKFLGGGTPMGATGGRADILELTNPGGSAPLYHGGSFNGNVLSSIAGRITLSHLTRGSIAEMDNRSLQLRHALEAKAAALGLPVTVQHIGSVMGIYFTKEPLRAGGNVPEEQLSNSFHLACANNGVHIGPGGVLALTTAVNDAVLREVISGMEDALESVAG